MEYKNTIITPKTDFPMKAGLPAREPGMLAKWEDNKNECSIFLVNFYKKTTIKTKFKVVG